MRAIAYCEYTMYIIFHLLCMYRFKIIYFINYCLNFVIHKCGSLCLLGYSNTTV